MSELQIRRLQADVVRLGIDLERMTAWVQVLANAGTAYKAELDAEKKRNEVLNGAWTAANNHRNALVEERRELSAEVGALKAENERLRIVLEKYADRRNWLHMNPDGFYKWFSNSDPCCVAREALEVKP